MKALNFFCTIFLLLIFSAKISAQELNCTVQVLSPQIQGTDPKRILGNLEKGLYEFMNSTKWTNDVFDINERITCTFILTVSSSPAQDQYLGSLQIISTRPIYKSSYNSVLFNWNDPDIDFSYVEFSPLEFSISSDLNNLTSIFAYYAYVILASDYDSFSPDGGTPYWLKAQTIVSNCQNSAQKGWKSSESLKNRFWIVDNMLQPAYEPIRQCNYKYHRLGFDIMYQDVAAGRATCLESLETLEKVHEEHPLSFPMQIFFSAKQPELVYLFSNALPDEKTKAAALFQKIDPGNGIKYQKILTTE